MYHRVFCFLRQKANWETRLLPTSRVPQMGIWVSPGTLITSYEIIAEGVSYIEYGVDRIPNRKTIMTILDWLEDREMIKRESNIRGTIIFIVNYDTYQSREDEKVTPKKQSTDIETDNGLDFKLDTTKEVKELKRIEKKEPKDTGVKKNRFTPPTIEQVMNYCHERENKVDPQKFIDYYESNGWRVGKNPMRSWQAAIRTWEKNDFGGNGNGKAQQGSGNCNANGGIKPAPGEYVGTGRPPIMVIGEGGKIS